MSETILDRIVRHKKREIADMAEIAGAPPCAQDFSRIFTPRPGLIAEIKAASPSEGVIVSDFDPVAIADDYLAGGATALSVLTDAAFFKGSFAILQAVRERTDRPILCKDFILSEKQIRQARLHGADMCLLIVKILAADRLAELKEAVEGLGMAAVVEIQTEAELKTALSVDPDILLINNRNLENFAVDSGTSNLLAGGIPPDVRVIAASGIRTPGDLAGFSPRVDGFLIGTALMRAADKQDFLRRCRAAKN